MNEQLQLYAIFHLNIAYSSIDVERRSEVVDGCYWPLLNLISEHQFRCGVELTGYTLEVINEIDPTWVETFKGLIEAECCELVGSGYAQIIGPLVPAKMNYWNQRLGVDVYKTLLGERPAIALVNEQAYSASMVKHYLDAGYSAIGMEWDNPAAEHPEWPVEWRYLPHYALSQQGEEIPLIWNNSIGFQKFQRYAHGDISLDDYLSYIHGKLVDRPRAFSIYGSDAEVFDFRPGRYKTEAALHVDGEWNRIGQLFKKLKDDPDIEVILPTKVLDMLPLPEAGQHLQLESLGQPIPVKKQMKYNVSRWAVTGRSDHWLNTQCQRIFSALDKSHPRNSRELWRRLSLCWASDLRTHITDSRWQQGVIEVESLLDELSASVVREASNKRALLPISIEELKQVGFDVSYGAEDILLYIRSPSVQLTLNLRRGLTIDSLAFRSQDFVPVVGTVPHGYFDSIELGADYYSAGTVVDLVSERCRITDLERVTPDFLMDGEALVIRGKVRTGQYIVTKEFRLSLGDESIGLKTELPLFKPFYGTVRMSAITFLPEAFTDELSLLTHNGGESEELFYIKQECDHSRPVSSLVSCGAGFGATKGIVSIGSKKRRVIVSWDPSENALFPMLSNKKSSNGSLIRIFLSLNECDETSVQKRGVSSFRYTLSASSGDSGRS